MNVYLLKMFLWLWLGLYVLLLCWIGLLFCGGRCCKGFGYDLWKFCFSRLVFLGFWLGGGFVVLLIVFRKDFVIMWWLLINVCKFFVVLCFFDIMWVVWLILYLVNSLMLSCLNWFWREVRGWFCNFLFVNEKVNIIGCYISFENWSIY